MNHKSILYVLVVFLFTSCKKLLEVNPHQSIEASFALQSKEGIESAANAVYATLQDVSLYGRDLIALPEALSDNATHTGTNSQLRGEALNQPGSSFSNWEASYDGINRANLVLEGLSRIDEPMEWKNSISGQMHFLRGLLYFNLARAYAYDPTAIIEASNRGGVPIITKGVISTDEIEYRPRDTIRAVYAFIYKELDSAFTQLEGTSNTRAPFYATKGGVAALFTRVALYNGDYERVIDEAEKALLSGVGKFQNHNDYINAWRAEVQPETMFGVEFKTNENVGANNSLRATFTTRADVNATTASTHGVLVVSDDLYNTYKSNDVRKELIWKGLGNNVSRNEMTKYFSRSGVKDLDNVPVIRISEVYLNRAEAAARLGEDSLALADLNKIRKRAGLTPVTGLTENSLLDAIGEQRRLELAFEGDRFFDLKRKGNDINKPAGNVRFSDYRMLARIPYREINAVPGLKQNPGY